MRDTIKGALRGVVYGLVIFLSIPYLAGAYYSLCWEQQHNSAWLRAARSHLRVMRRITDDQDLRNVLDYTLDRYDHIGPWNVMIFPCPTFDGQRTTLGVNAPWCPGLTLDPSITNTRLSFGAVILVHESLHDWWPYLGHGHIEDREVRLMELSEQASKLTGVE